MYRVVTDMLVTFIMFMEAHMPVLGVSPHEEYRFTTDIVWRISELFLPISWIVGLLII